MRADLHTHSSYSDGRLSPADLVEKAISHNLDALALTDHDTVEGWEEAEEAADDTGLNIVYGVEMTAVRDRRHVHILGYFADPDGPKPGIRDCLNLLAKRRVHRMQAIVGRLNKQQVALSEDAVRAQVGSGTIGRPHIAQALVEEGLVASYGEAFQRYLADGQVAALPLDGPSPADIVKAIRSDGGVAVLAHPGRHYDEDFVEQLLAEGLDGLEVVHPSHDRVCRLEWQQFARSRDMVQTGGSDYHGFSPVDEHRFGYYSVGRQRFRDLVDRLAV